ncbi:hypothetical protein [Flavobacterium phycosphaerae]|uniref:hypothetical protein n=1 Tax=Flavobacterium phycosphaerae TaxID=2697515 RepID=UPI001389FD73|nr:hypothetical protein [Flavobacterium phycosphaerae]
MKTIKLALFILAFIQYSSSIKRDLLDEIERYQKSLVENKPYNAERPQVYEAMNVSGAQEYQKFYVKVKAEDFANGILKAILIKKL